MRALTDVIHAAFVPFLIVTGGLLLLVVCHIVVLHGVRELAFRRRQRLLSLYRPLLGDRATGGAMP